MPAQKIAGQRLRGQVEKGPVTASPRIGTSMDLIKRNAEIVALVKARKMPMREIAARYRLSTSSISLIAIRHGVHAQLPTRKRCGRPAS